MGKKKAKKPAAAADDDGFDDLLAEFTPAPPAAPTADGSKEEVLPPAAPAADEASGEKTLSAADQALKDLGLLDDDEPVKEKVRGRVITTA